jgi:hypothetical protein
LRTRTTRTSRRLCYRLGTGFGSVEYLLTYSAANGVYAASESIVLRRAGDPGEHADSINYPETSFTIHVGESVSLNLDDIQFTDWTAPQDAPVWRQIWNDSGDWGSVEESWNQENTVRTNTFQSAGRYTVYLAAGVGNYQYLMLVTITVLPEGQDTLQLDLHDEGFATPRCTWTRWNPDAWGM